MESMDISSLERTSTKDECIFAYRIYDSCRQQDCLILPVLNINGTPYSDHVPITFSNALTVTPEIKDIRPNNIKEGYFDIDIEYTFDYNVRGASAAAGPKKSIFTKTVTLFGSKSSDVTIATNFPDYRNGTAFEQLSQNVPYVIVEASVNFLKFESVPIAGSADRNFLITLGLFTMIKISRPVNLIVKSTGFCKPEKCVDPSDDVCDFFENDVKFPFDIFNPPQK
ncbi:MAG: hypothetical protein K0R54_2602 [Clostridiaceae bacterium]|jgi:hypothetical protein|nr:hypothetical protein [Clostridiaceae bacterium]